MVICDFPSVFNFHFNNLICCYFFRYFLSKDNSRDEQINFSSDGPTFDLLNYLPQSLTNF